MTRLKALLAKRIRASGPISVAEYMAECLMHPQHGYYSTRDPFGAKGDFTTAPEISQMFGEMIGLWLAQVWIDQGAPDRFILAELGPGRGTLMADILRATAKVPGFGAAADVHLVETSPTLRARQSETIKRPLTHLASAEDLPEAPLFLVANEFFDALPIRQFIRTGTLWSERMVGLKGEELTFGRSAAHPVADLDHRSDVEDGQMVEICPQAGAVMGVVGDRIAQAGGAALIIDYGDWRSGGDTLQALKDHSFDPPLAHPGEADLTAHVDFEALAQAAGIPCSQMTPQGVFLERLGITQRAQALARGLEGEALDAQISAHRRLTHPEEMGNLFKVLGFAPEGAPGLPGLTSKGAR